MTENASVAILTKKEALTPATFLISLEYPEILSFKAGQHIGINIPTPDGHTKRYFSIASPPTKTNIIELIIKIIPGGLASVFFERSNVGDQISISPPKGDFCFLNHENGVHFISSGTGIAPLRSMIYDLLKNHKFAYPIHLISGFSMQDEIIFHSEFEDCKKAHPNFQYTLITSKDASDYRDLCISNINFDQKNNFYLCGGDQFITHIENNLLQRGIARDLIHYENYK
ncbi:MAG: FAD-dependent oxidoreductase [Patescibacteria group bacterium]